MSSEHLYLLDTNVIYDMLTLLTDEPSPIGRSLESFFARRKGPVFLSDLVWTEFSVSWFQKNITFADYDYWHNRKLALYAQIYQQLLRRNVELLNIVKLSEDGYVGVMDLARDLTIVKYDEAFIRTVHGNSGARLAKAMLEKPSEKDLQAHAEYINRLTKNHYSGKLLDGFDSVILASSILFAQAHPESTVTLISNDRWMGNAANHLITHAQSYSLVGLTQRPFSLKISTPSDLSHLLW